MVTGEGQPASIYLPLYSGQVYASQDGGASWRLLADDLPPILRASVA